MSDPTHRTPSEGPQDLADLLAAVSDAQRGRHRREGLIAQGGMGTIEGVYDRSLDRQVALKRIHEELEVDASQVAMFVREARVTGQLQHPCVVPVHELGVDDERHLYYTMERVEGRTLEEWVDGLPRAPMDRSTLFDLLDVVVRVCDALGYAHGAGILHCDVKPANIMVGRYGQVYLMDWGIARYLKEEQARDEAGPTVGTAAFMAPEQARGEPLDARADVFAVGALIYYFLTRRPPFRLEGYIQSLLASCMCTFPPLDEQTELGRAPAALSRIVLRAMAKKREDRHESVGELKDALVRFMRGVDGFPRVTFQPGQDIVVEGELGGEAYVIESGRCEVHRQIDGQRKSIRVMEAGDVFGEMAVLSPGARTASVTALEETTLLRIDADTLQAELDSMKPWMGALVRTLAERFRERESTG
jgi:serine/threonine-protein kinase